MSILIRTLSVFILWSFSQGVGLSQNPDENARKPEPGSLKSGLNGDNAAGRTLDDLRNELKKKTAYAGGGMPESGAGMGMGMMGGSMMGGMGSSMGGGMMGSGGMGAGEMGMGGPPPEKQLLTQIIQQLRGRLGSKKFNREKVEKQLRSALQQYFDLDMEERVNEFDKVKARVAEMESKLQRRLDNEGEIVELQLKQMLHQADGLDFSVPNGNSGGYGDMYGGLGMGSMDGYGGGFDMGGMAGSYQSGGDMGANMDDPKGIGYDAAFEFTRIQRLDESELDDSDPLKSYAQSQTTALTDTPPNADADKLKTILLAFHQFESRFHHLPRSANRHVKDQPPHSWRVAILPLIGQNALYSEYQFDQPWDSEQNLQVAKKMPALYRSGAGKQDTTQFMMIVGGGAFDSSDRPVSFADITDGTANTIALIQSDRDVVWTKPEDVTYSTNGPLPTLSTARLIGMADGSAKHLPQIKDSDFRALITRAKGETIKLPQP